MRLTRLAVIRLTIASRVAVAALELLAPLGEVLRHARDHRFGLLVLHHQARGGLQLTLQLFLIAEGAGELLDLFGGDLFGELLGHLLHLFRLGDL